MSNVVALPSDWSRTSALARWFTDPLVREIMVNAGREIWIEREGGVEHVGVLAHGELSRIIERILLPIGRRVDQASPVVDARLADGSRVCIVIPPVAVDGPCLSIRRFHVRDLPLSAFGGDDVVSSCVTSLPNAATWWWQVLHPVEKPHCSMHCAGVSLLANDSSPWRTSPSCGYKPNMSFDSKRARQPTTGLWR